MLAGCKRGYQGKPGMEGRQCREGGKPLGPCPQMASWTSRWNRAQTGGKVRREPWVTASCSDMGKARWGALLAVPWTGLLWVRPVQHLALIPRLEQVKLQSQFHISLLL